MGMTPQPQKEKLIEVILSYAQEAEYCLDRIAKLLGEIEEFENKGRKGGEDEISTDDI